MGGRKPAPSSPAAASRSVDVSGRYSSSRSAAPNVLIDSTASMLLAEASDRGSRGAASVPRDELRLDVDGRYPQMAASGTIQASRVQRLHWLARLTREEAGVFTGRIWYKFPASIAFPYTTVTIAVSGRAASSRRARATFSAPGLPDLVRTYTFRSPHFRSVGFEFDAVEGVTPVVQVDTGAHRNRPPSLAVEPLSIQTIYERAGLRVQRSGDSVIPIAGSGADSQWSDAEMHDAMQAYWSRFANRAQWAMWVLFATQHETGTTLGGIMFDEIGPNHRQGTAIFYNSFISERPRGDRQRDAYQARTRLWTAVHEMGHAFNLAHSWQKSLGTSWVPLADEPEARSFMNYPFRVSGGDGAFFNSFEYRFSDPELLFMRHAPEPFVRMGAADWFDEHAFREVAERANPPLSVELRVNRSRPTFEFLEPVVIEVKVKNISSSSQEVDKNVVDHLDGVTLAMKRQGSPARQFVPYARYCSQPSPRVLAPGEAIYGSVFVSAGLNGIDVAEPGRYILQAAMHRDGGDIVSAPLLLRIAPPMNRDEEVIAQDYLTDSVGRVLAFDGTRVLQSANDTLREVTDRLADRRVARHARVALGVALSEDHKVLSLGDTVQTELRPASALAGAHIACAKADTDQAQAELTAALTDDTSLAAETLGHIDFTYYVGKLVDLLGREGERSEAAQVLSEVMKTLSARGVLKRVIDRIERERDRIAAVKPA